MIKTSYHIRFSEECEDERENDNFTCSLAPVHALELDKNLVTFGLPRWHDLREAREQHPPRLALEGTKSFHLGR